MLGSAVCSICTESYDSEKAVAAMPCGHTFHDECLERWLHNTRNCPSCRKPLRKSQHPIHRLYFDVDLNRTQVSGGSKCNLDDNTSHENRKLKLQVNSLESTIRKLESQCQDAQDQKAALACLISDKDAEIKYLIQAHEKMKRKVKDYTNQQTEIDQMKQKLEHLKNIQVILEGVESEVKNVLEEKAGYSTEQLTYVILLRQQLENSRKTNDKLKEDITQYKEKISNNQRKLIDAEAELKILRMEIKQCEQRNTSLSKKCDELIKAINSPGGVSRSLAQRLVFQSPAPKTITPFAQPSSLDQGSVVNDTSCSPVLDKKVASSSNSSPDLFPNTSTSFVIEEDAVKQLLDFLDEGEPLSKRPKLINSKALLEQSSHEAEICDNLPALVKPKSTLKVKSRHKLTPMATSSHVKDITNTNHTKHSASGSTSSQFFRQGYDGLGGQTQIYQSNRNENALRFNIFKKPLAKTGTSSQSKSIEIIDIG